MAGLTTQACAFSGISREYMDAGPEVIGINPDDEIRNSNFATNHRQLYFLLSDKNNSVRNLFGVPIDMSGLLTSLVTYIPDKTGLYRCIFNVLRRIEKPNTESFCMLKEKEEAFQLLPASCSFSRLSFKIAKISTAALIH